MTEKENADGRPVIRKSPRPHQAGGRGRPPAGKGAHTAPLQTPAGPRRGHGTIPPHGTRPKGRAGPFFLFGRSASPLDHTGVAEPVNAPRNGLRPA